MSLCLQASASVFSAPGSFRILQVLAHTSVIVIRILSGIQGKIQVILVLGYILYVPDVLNPD